MSLFPDLHGLPFFAIEANLLMLFDDYTDDVVRKLELAFPVETENLNGFDFESHGAPVRLSVEFEGGDRISIAAAKLDPADVGVARHEVPILTQNAVQKRISALWNLDVLIDLTCSFAVNIDELPANGLVRRGLGADTRIGGELLRLSGAQFAINGDPEHTLSWYVETGSLNWREVSGKVFRRMCTSLSPDRIAEVIFQSQQQFERLVLERQPSVAI